MSSRAQTWTVRAAFGAVAVALALCIGGIWTDWRLILTAAVIATPAALVAVAVAHLPEDRRG